MTDWKIDRDPLGMKIGKFADREGWFTPAPVQYLK